MTTHRQLNRRMAVVEMGKAGLAVVVFGAAACSGTDGTVATTTTPGAVPTTTPAPGTVTTTDGTTTTSAEGTTTVAPAAFQRVNLDFVSAYILYRGGEAALVDTGVDGSADAIEAALGEVGLAWDSVGQVIPTHKHPDHMGRVDAVLEPASGATVYAGARTSRRSPR